MELVAFLLVLLILATATEMLGFMSAVVINREPLLEELNKELLPVFVKGFQLIVCLSLAVSLAFVNAMVATPLLYLGAIIYSMFSFKKWDNLFNRIGLEALAKDLVDKINRNS